MSRTVLVLGATGKTGRRLVPRLTEHGLAVRAASRTPAAGQILFDWDRADTHDAALSGADAVYLVPPDFVEDATAVVGPFLERARAAGVAHVVALSSQGAGFPGEPAGSGRRRLEAAVRDSGLGWTILRPTGFAQNFSEGFLLPGILQGGVVVTASGDGAVAFVDAGDIAAVAAAALADATAHAGATHAITGAEALTFAAAAAIVADVSGRALTPLSVPAEAMRETLLGLGVPADYAEMLLRDMRATSDGHSAAVTDTVARVTGRDPVAFRDFAVAAAGTWRP